MNAYSKIGLLIFNLLFISCSNTEETTEIELKDIPVFVTELNPVDDNNVIQGIASFENGWFVTQKSGTSLLLINYLDNNGVSLYHKRFSLNSHGQDLSLEHVSENQLHLFTTKGSFDGNRNTGILKFSITLPDKVNNERDWTQLNITVENEYNLNYIHATPTLDEEKQQFAIRSNNTILIHNKELIDANDFTSSNHFQLNDSQLIDNGNFSMWYQGIAMKNNLVYCLTGNDKLATHKKIYVYSQNGIVTKKFTFDKDDLGQNFLDKFEPEGLTFKNNELYFTIMTKNNINIGNIKYLYKIAI